MNKKINIMYFSATGTTEKIIYGIVNGILKNIDSKVIINSINFTLPESRK